MTQTITGKSRLISNFHALRQTLTRPLLTNGANAMPDMLTSMMRHSVWQMVKVVPRWSAFASIRPAVVNITADRVTRRTGGSLTAGSVTFDNPAIRFVEEQSLGSGIVVDPRGFILSNAHVVSAAQSLKVITFGFERREYKAELVAKNTAMDIAILRIRPVRPLVAAVLGDSDMLRVAERVIAIGSPFGLEQTVTAGIISDTSRNLIIEGNTYEEMIQTDAAINRGNSGGPLVNLKGEVIGINTAIYAPTGVFTGVGFAIPVNRIRPLVKEVLANRNT